MIKKLIRKYLKLLSLETKTANELVIKSTFMPCLFVIFKELVLKMYSVLFWKHMKYSQTDHEFQSTLIVLYLRLTFLHFHLLQANKY